MDEAPIKPIEKKNDATKRMRVRFTIMASFIFGEGRHLLETHGNIKAVPPGSRMPPSVHRLSVMEGIPDFGWPPNSTPSDTERAALAPLGLYKHLSRKF
jgi:hypothetical protein